MIGCAGGVWPVWFLVWQHQWSPLDCFIGKLAWWLSFRCYANPSPHPMSFQLPPLNIDVLARAHCINIRLYLFIACNFARFGQCRLPWFRSSTGRTTRFSLSERHKQNNEYSNNDVTLNFWNWVTCANLAFRWLALLHNSAHTRLPVIFFLFFMPCYFVLLVTRLGWCC